MYFTDVLPHLDASCRHDLLHSFLQLEHFDRRGGSDLSSIGLSVPLDNLLRGSLGGRQPYLDMQSSARGSALGF